jgi:hypothetical protein
MNCQEFWDHLPLRGADIKEAQAAHLAECANCAKQWAPHQALAASLHSLSAEFRHAEAPARVELGLMAAIRAQAGYRAKPSLVRSMWRPVLAWTSAAAATVALATVLVHGFQPSAATPGTGAAPRHPSRSTVQTASAVEVESDDESAVLGEGFVRLPNVPRIEANEDFNVVRVEVQGSAMIEAGISLSEDRAEDTVLADVALASDGTPRAVRLVPDGGSN